MRITFKLYAMLSDHLPQQVEGRARVGNAIELDVPEGTTIQALIDRFALPEKLVPLVLLDGTFVPKEQRSARALADGEVLAIWPPIAGG
jgi:sulfur carrier protein ThiS